MGQDPSKPNIEFHTRSAPPQYLDLVIRGVPLRDASRVASPHPARRQERRRTCVLNAMAESSDQPYVPHLPRRHPGRIFRRQGSGLRFCLLQREEEEEGEGGEEESSDISYDGDSDNSSGSDGSSGTEGRSDSVEETQVERVRKPSLSFAWAVLDEN